MYSLKMTQTSQVKIPFSLARIILSFSRFIVELFHLELLATYHAIMGVNHSNMPSEMGKFFGGLPKYVLLPILIDWLTMNEVCLLDSSMCNRAERKVFMTWLGGEHSVTLSGKIHEKYNGVQYWQWLSVRNIHVHHISLFFEYFERDFCGKVIRKPYCEELLNLIWGSKHTQVISKVVTKEMALPKKVNSIKLSGLTDKDMPRFNQLNPTWLLALTLIDFDISAPYNIRVVGDFVCVHCKSLQELTIHGCGDLPSRLLKNILESSSELVRLSLLERKLALQVHRSEEDFSKWTVNCTKLKYLSMYQIGWGCEGLFEAIASHCPDLEHIALLMMDFDSSCVEAVSSHCRKLISVSIESYPDRRHPESLFEAFASNSRSLEYINIQSSYSQSTHLGVLLLLAHCPRLKYIYANYNYTALDRDLPEEGIVTKSSRRLSGWFDPYNPITQSAS